MDGSHARNSHAYDPLERYTRDSIVGLTAAKVIDRYAEDIGGGQRDAIFRGTGVCSMSIPRYLVRIFKWSKCSIATAIVMLASLYRLLELPNGVTFVPLTAHRLVAATFILAVKFTDESVLSTDEYAKIFGMNKQEVVLLEMHTFRMLDYSLMVTREQYIQLANYCLDLTNEWQIPLQQTHSDQNKLQ